ncbi:hypothetical protein U5801_20290 [Lamprobacter modestohalophilus]|uniref:hypothetical protein n=1 Tax=Lamprobacter modestohalophilus TaxID=1064514 RepID=UPI002ADEF386|nr:hypothetical protein [Lamprobacter modestohalophilus]MEA1052128.1 hypothetical protein [Lamprobacter modestohalophilus]
MNIDPASKRFLSREAAPCWSLILASLRVLRHRAADDDTPITEPAKAYPLLPAADPLAGQGPVEAEGDSQAVLV